MLNATTISIHGNQYGQLFCNDQDSAVVSMQSKADCGNTLNQVVQEYGVPKLGIHMDNAGEESSAFTKWEKTRKHFLIKQTFLELHSPWMNRAGGKIGCIKTHYWSVMNCHWCPEALWCFGMEYTSRF